MNLRAHHRRREVCGGFRNDLARMNGIRSRYFEVQVDLLVYEVMRAKSDADRELVEEMVFAIWRAET